MAKFLRDLLLVCLLPLVLLSIPLCVFIYTGEFVSYDAVANAQARGENSIWSRAYSDVDREFKTVSATYRGAAVVVLGSSRVMTIRSGFFTPETTFYNAGGAAQWPAEPKEFISSIPRDRQPRLILLGVDQRWFSDSVGVGIAPIGVEKANDPAMREFLHYSWKKFYQDYVRGKFSLRDIFKKPGGVERIGFNAVVYNSGFRGDGSMFYGKFLDDPKNGAKVKTLIDEKVATVLAGKSNFEYSDRVNEHTLASIDEFLSECRRRGITVVGFMPPYAHGVYERVMSVPGPDKRVADLVSKRLDETFAAQGATFYDLSDPASFGGSDSELFDIVHGMDKMSARIVSTLGKRDPAFSAFVDPVTLDATIASSTSDYEVTF